MHSSYKFTDVLLRRPGNSIADGLRDGSGPDPDVALFKSQYEDYIAALAAAGVKVTLLDAIEEFPDSVFIEDAAICIGNTAIVTRPGADTRFGEAQALRPDLETRFSHVVELTGEGRIEGGDVLVAETEVFAGLSARTNQEGLAALGEAVQQLGFGFREVVTPATILHFKTACGLLDSETIFASAELAATGCFEGYRVVTAPEGEEAAANLIRVNDAVIVSSGFDKTTALLRAQGYRVVTVDTSEAAKVDAGLSCMSLRYNPTLDFSV